ncbi:granzyme G isoform X2 [Cynoglossus semilaevis]|uniref:granzyme G isoform X2 n=1 Tax=Cynoglossus semilaevis TaxID=244447 RepID=UPI000D625AE9|nr:granzyme G-like isoform X2 [Cynoglossus semilaevis]
MFTHCLLVPLVLVLTHEVYAGKIIGGHEAVPHSRPYMVFLRGDENGSPRYCGGFLLNEDFVITAAHCKCHSNFTVFLGVHNAKNRKEPNVQKISVEQEFPHENYSDVTRTENDIMLLKLSTKAIFNKDVRPIELPQEDIDFLPESCFVSGWGRNNKETNYLSVTLMEVNVTLIDNENCTKSKSYCSEGEAGPAKGDSGGPLVCEDEKAYGVVSHVFIPLSRAPPVHYYTRIQDHVNWIKSVINRDKKRAYI